MMKRFFDGLIFGAGFTISFIILWYLAAYSIQPIVDRLRFERLGIGADSEISDTKQASSAQRGLQDIPFHALRVDDQIKQSSIIALAQYEQASDGRMKAVIKEFLKKDPNTIFYYDVGDEYSPSSYFPKDNTSYGDGAIIFFTGSPATMKSSMSYSDNRVRALGDIPIELLREKCRENNA